MIGIVGRKKEMSQIFSDDGKVVPVTLVEVPGCVVTQVKTEASDGYSAVQLGFGSSKNINKSLKGHIEEAGMESVETLFEFRVSDIDKYKVGQKVFIDILMEGEIVDVSGYSKGKGFQGVVKRHGYSGGPDTHGSRSHRVPGSMGASATPSRVLKGKKLPGRMGGDHVTVKNIEIVKIDKDNNIVAVKGAIPGSRNSIVLLRKTTERGKRK
jgi:large subunit ribosomal protein L3